MKKLKAILSIVLMGVLIFSTLGFSVSRHYCMGMLVDERFYQAPEHCGMDGDARCEDDRQQIRTDCCDDETIAIPGLEVQSISKEQINLPFVADLVYSTTAIQPFVANFTSVSIKDPPLVFLLSGRQILVLEQRFLI